MPLHTITHHATRDLKYMRCLFLFSLVPCEVGDIGCRLLLRSQSRGSGDLPFSALRKSKPTSN